MAIIKFKTTIFLLPLLFISTFAQIWKDPNAYKLFNHDHVLGPHELFGNPFGNPFDFQLNIPNDIGTPLFKGENVAIPVGKPSNAGAVANASTSAADLGYKGDWELVSQNSGVSAMHAILLPKVDKVLMYDATIWKISKLPLPNGQCRIVNKNPADKDCWCHSILFDINTGELTPLELNTDTWCSSGGLDVNGNLVSTGGYQGGANTVRYLNTCPGCNWREYPTALADRRWYSTQATLPDGGYIVVGGRDAFSYEYIPAEGKSNTKPFFFEFLRQTSDPEENNLYPFVHLSTDGNVFIFANSRSVLLDPKSNKIVREFPVLAGGHRSYPASGMSALLPLKLHDSNPDLIPAEVLVCGGSAHKDAYSKAEKQIFFTALQDCARIKITDKNAVWKRELMPTPRLMGDAMILPTGDLLLLNGAKRGASGWGFARDPNFVPVLYNPRAKRGQRFTELAPTQIARMYHSTSVVLPDGKVLVGGSNTNNGYIYDAMYPTELRIEKYSPPYLNANLAGKRSEIIVVPLLLLYGLDFQVQIKLNGVTVEQKDIKLTMYAPAFTTHGVNMNQRLIDLGLKQVLSNPILGLHTITAVAPPSGIIAPPGYYLFSAVYQGVPSISKWVQIK
ncbi:aldehyde oxidase GLOX1 [Mercurialis annua]|uniref:aldehyde oxidase GLOX1 n=1 Tax=Mercurialis annua TaxID=3986 RepID=UPI00215F304E|nr:aldehyde oxidase GLOX1 [Mercurialis annua]